MSRVTWALYLQEHFFCRKRAMSRNGDDDEDGWEYYYEEEDEEEESAPAAIVVTEAEVVNNAKPAQITKPEDHKQSRPSSRQTRCQFHQQSMNSFFSSRLTLILLAHGLEQ
jgi:hypothetical protein